MRSKDFEEEEDYDEDDDLELWGDLDDALESELADEYQAARDAERDIIDPLVSAILIKYPSDNVFSIEDGEITTQEEEDEDGYRSGVEKYIVYDNPNSDAVFLVIVGSVHNSWIEFNRRVELTPTTIGMSIDALDSFGRLPLIDTEDILTCISNYLNKV